MKVMLLANTSWYLNNFRASLIERLHDNGDTVMAVAPLDDHSQTLAEKVDNYRPWQLKGSSKNPWHELRSIWNLYQSIKQEKPDCILSYTPKANIYASLIAKVTGTKMVCNVSGLGNVFIEGGATQQLVKGLYRFAFSKVEKVFFQNQDDQALFLKMHLVAAKKVSLLPGSGVDVRHFSPEHNQSRDDQPFTFLFVGRMLKEKGLFEYVTAASQVKAQFPNTHFILQGPIVTTNPTAVTVGEITRWEATGVVSYWPETDQVRDSLAQVDCVVLPSYREGMPRSLLEAASMEKPVITTDVPGCREVVDDGETGFLCQLQSADDLAEKMQQLLQLSDKERTQMGVRAREKMLQGFDEEIVLHAYLQVLALWR